jgi:PmbA protein
VDNGLEEASERRPFDDEGIVSKKRELIDKGVVKNFIYDKEVAALAKVKKNGFCNRAHFSSSPGAGTSNVLIYPGKYSDLEQEIKDPLIVHSLHGSHTANTTTGDFGLEVNVAFHKGKPVRGFMLSANIFKLLKQKILLEKNAICYGNLIAPRIAFTNMQVIS